MAANTPLTLQAVVERIDAAEAAHPDSPTQQAFILARLATQLHDASNTSTSSGAAVKVLVQGELCSKLLKTLKSSHTPQQHNSPTIIIPTPPTAPPAATTPASQDEATTADVTLAEAWASACQALALIYKWEEEEVVLSVIQFCSKVSSLLCGSWLQEAAADQQAASATPSPLQANTSQELQYLQWLWALSPAAIARVVEQLYRFWQLTGINHLVQQQQQATGSPSHPSKLNLLLLFLELHCGNGSNSSKSSIGTPTTTPSWCGQSSQPAVQLLRLLHGNSADMPATVCAAITAGEAFAAATCLLQAAAVLHISAVDGQQQQASAAAASHHTAHSSVPAWQVLARHAGSFLRDCYGWCSFGEASNMPAAAAAAASEAARHAAAGFHAFSTTASSTHGVFRPSNVDSLYDCHMMQLLQRMQQGPSQGGNNTTTSSSSHTVPGGASSGTQQPDTAATGDNQGAGGAAGALSEQAWEAWVDSEPFCALAALIATYDRPQVLVRGLHTLTQQQLAAAENAAAVAAVEAEAEAAAAAGDQCAATGASTPAPTGTHSSQHSKASSKKAEKAAMGRVLLLLDSVFLWRQHWLRQTQQGVVAATPDSRRADAGGVRQLLLGLSELLRAAANAKVEWRCAALAAMLSAVEDFAQQHPGAGDLELQLWDEASVEGLLYCATHDPSIQARRSAVQLLQHVALPSSSPTARALVSCLADKVCDKDSGVSAAALQLFVQLEPRVLASCLTASQWCAAVQAALELTCSSTGGGGGGSSRKAAPAYKSTPLRKQLAQLFKKVALLDVPSDSVGHASNSWLGGGGGRGSVGLEGCKQVLLLLMAEPALADTWQRLVVVGEGA